jgi:ankyrin repeat protein
MSGNDQVRFCEHCQLQVTNLSTMTRHKAMRLVARSQGRLCVRYIKKPDGGVLTRGPEQLYRIGRRASRLAAGAMTATLGLTAAAGQTRSGSAYQPQPAQISSPKSEPEAGATLSGVITDPIGALVAGAKVKLVSKDSHIAFSYMTSDDGSYRFALLDPGSYDLSIEGGGFAPADLPNVEVLPNSTKLMNVQMQIPTFVVQVRIESPIEITDAVNGAIAFVAPEEPLVRAAYQDDLSAVRQLIFSSPDINVRDKSTHMTALDHAVENSNVEMMRALLAAGAWVNSKSETGWTALMYLREKASAELVRELVSAGGLVNEQNESGETALINAVSLSNQEVVKELLQAGASTTPKDSVGKTALMHAAADANPEVVSLLIAAGAAIEEKDQAGKTALMFAAEEGEPETVKTLIRAGAQINQLDNNGWTAFMFAVNVQDVESVETLLSAGADISARDNKGKTALALAREAATDQKGLVKLLESRGAPE